jgi:hypothetical protein
LACDRDFVCDSDHTIDREAGVLRLPDILDAERRVETAH